MRTVRLTESTTSRVTLTDGEAASLRQIGQALASRTRWWGDDADYEDDEEPSTRAVVRCWAVSDCEYAMRVSDAVGVIGLEQTQLIIDPKIALPHLMYLFAESDQLPRHLLERSRLGADANFFSVIAAWFIETCEALLRHGLVSDYARVTGDLACARGRIHTVATARSVMVGRPVIRCDYDLRRGHGLEPSTEGGVAQAAGIPRPARRSSRPLQANPVPAQRRRQPPT